MNAHSLTDAPPAARRAQPAGRRATAREVIRTRLLDAAEELIAERQVAAITARDIARRAGASDGVLYNHFADKHELLLAALVRRFERLVATFHERVADVPVDGDPDAELEAIAAATLELHRASLPMLANIVSEPALFHRFMAAIHRPPLGGHVFSNPFEAHVLRRRGAAYAEGLDPKAVGDLLVGALLLLALAEVLGGRPAAVTEERMHAAVRTVVHGLATRTSGEPGID